MMRDDKHDNCIAGYIAYLLQKFIFTSQTQALLQADL